MVKYLYKIFILEVIFMDFSDSTIGGYIYGF